jgi:hypothetical protein
MHAVVDSRPMTFSERDEIARYYECVGGLALSWHFYSHDPSEQIGH